MYNFNDNDDIQTLTTFSDARDGRVDDGNRHIIDIIFYLKFAKIYLDNKSYGDQVSISPTSYGQFLQIPKAQKILSSCRFFEILAFKSCL